MGRLFLKTCDASLPWRLLIALKVVGSAPSSTAMEWRWDMGFQEK
jgi:hypothetical protein